MSTLTGTQVNNTYDGLIKMSHNGTIDSVVRDLEDGLGNTVPIAVSTTIVDMTGASAISGSEFSGSFVGDGSGLTGLPAGTTYDLSSGQNGDDVDIDLTPSSGDTDTVTLVAGTNITLTDDGSNNVTIDASGGGGTPGGSNHQVQFNNAGAFGGDANFTFDDGTNNLTLTGEFDLNGNLDLDGNIQMTNDHLISFDGLGGSTKVEGIQWPNFQTWGEELDNNATGETIAAGTTITPNDGELYCFRTGGGWAQANNGSQTTAAGTLGWSVHDATTNRFLVKGMISVKNTEMLGTSPGIGDIVYIAGTDGHFTSDEPSGAGDIIRKCGQIMDTFVSGRTTYYKIWFDPDWYYETA